MDEEYLRLDFRSAESSLLEALPEPPDVTLSSPKAKDYRTVSRACNPQYKALETKTVKVRHLEFGSSRPVIIAGPCAVESRDQTMEVARAVCSAGADMLRGGAFKPRTSPYDFQGLGEEGLKILAAAREETGLPIVTEVLDVRLVDLVGRYADMIQIGSRSMQSFPLLVEVGRLGKPVLLKRGMAATLHEWLCAAEYVAKEGNTEIVLCERGIRTFSAGEYSRFCLDLNVVKAVREATYLPVIVDPSHATGDADMVPMAAEAAIAYGAHGLIIEVMGTESRREELRCDGQQAIRPEALRQVISRVRRSMDGSNPEVVRQA
jgi:3-deoxy-7-phosphoheptulonate synthase